MRISTSSAGARFFSIETDEEDKYSEISYNVIIKSSTAMKRTELKPTEAYRSPEINVVSVLTEKGFAGSPDIADFDYGYEDWD